MSSFPPAYLERLIAQPHRGELEPADAAGEVGSVVGGSGVRLTLAFARGGGAPRRIAAARWRAFGGVAAIGPGSALCERLPGLSDAAALAIPAAALLEGLGAVPPPVERAAAHVVEALALALGPTGPATASVRAPGVLVCRCLGVGDKPIRHAIRGGAADVPAIGLVTSAGHGCHSCWPDLRALLEEETAPGPSRAAGAPPAGTLLERAVEALVRPTWRAQGVTLGSVRVTGDAVLLSVMSIAQDALASPIGAVAIARHVLRETLSEGLRVELAPPAGAAIPTAVPSAAPHVPPSRAR